jgi:Cns1/TTC4 Wheel domain
LRPPDLGPIESFHLSDPLNAQSDLCFPAILLYPLSSQTDLIAEFFLSTTVTDQLTAILEQPPPWDVKGEYNVDNVECFMEIEKEEGMGLIKIGKEIPMINVVKGRIILDGIIRILIIPKDKVQQWISEWKRNNTKS